jgi:isoleucyl-tRNA synthetase
MEPEPTALNTLSQITTEILKRFAPLTPFLAEHFYRFVSIEGATNSHSIFQKNLHLHSPPVGQNLESTDTKTDEAKAEWEARKSAYDAKS